MEASVGFVKMCRNFLAVTIVVLFLSELHCHCFLAYAGASHVTRGRSEGILQVENGHARRTPKLGTLQAVNFGSAEALLSTSHRVMITSFRGRHANTSRSRQEVAFLTGFKAVVADPLGVLKSWDANDSSVCGWIGVVCSSDRHPQHAHATGLELGGRQLVGNIASAIQVLCNLPFLQRLDLSHNVFRGSIPGPSLANCSKLSYLNISNNQLTGAIPRQLGGLVNLEALDMVSNNITGEIPASLGNCTLLKVLHLGSNFLEGQIPWVLGKLSRLEVLNITAKLPARSTYNNVPFVTKSLSGSIPPALGNCSSLTYLGLEYNSNLGGKLPFELSQLKRLQWLRLSFCHFDGAVPTWLGNLTGLSDLYINYNWFQGDIPHVMGQLRGLKSFGMGENNMSGVIPISITNCTKLIYLDLFANNLTGDIPPQLGLLRNLLTLDLRINSFTGDIPSSIANCSALIWLGLGANPLAPQIIPSWIGSLANLNTLSIREMNLQGEIPVEVGKLFNLDFLLSYGNNLTGVIPSSLENCTLLEGLDLQHNHLTGEIPPGIGQLTNLYWLGLSGNFLTGFFPAVVTNLTQMETLLLYGNSLTGTIDGDFGRLQQLRDFEVDENQFRGSIPGTLSNCSKLFEIWLDDNSLSGEIPPSMGNLTRLEVLRLGYNNIGGRIPADIAKCSRLVFLSLQFNNFEGSVLPITGQLSLLQTLQLADNNFSGVLPSSLRNSSVMYELDLSYNQFTGHVSGYIFSEMASLTYLNLSHNLFSGPWPPQLSQLSSLQEIDFSVNNISGPLPPGLGSCLSLVRLDVSFNILTGVIPQSLGLLRDLGFLNASYNNFEGPIPESVVSKANLSNASFLGNPRLCGLILGPDRTCSNWSRSCEGFKCEKIWIPTMFGLTGAALIVVGVLCWMKIVCWSSGRNEEKYLILNFAPHSVRVSERDVLAIIQGGDENVIGKGAKSVVYKGVLPGGSRDMFAIKIVRSRFEECPNDDYMYGVRRDNDLVTEVRALAQLRHRHILKLFSFCSTLNVQALILEYMPEGCLHKRLHELGDARPLTWQERFKIAVGVAEAMVYLHHDYHKALIHRDLKPSNILLDSNLDPKVADFGISKFAGQTRDGEATASTICGTVGYMPPEYAMGTSVSTKGDVYSYGVVLIELLTGTQPTSWENFRPSQSSNLKESSSIMELLEEDTVELLDSTLKQEAIQDSQKNDQMMLLMRVALFCTRETPEGRPSMKDVLAMLMQIKGTGLIAIVPRTMEDLAHEPASQLDESDNSSSF